MSELNSDNRPDYTSTVYGISIWKNIDKNGNEYLTIQIPLLKIQTNCFKIKKVES